MNLFENEYTPLAEKLRPQNLNEFVGQEKILHVIKRMIEGGKLPSIILHGVPGTGKTTLAKIISNTIDAEFVKINAALSGIAELRGIVKTAELQRKLNRRTILFIDEIHRFNKSLFCCRMLRTGDLL